MSDDGTDRDLREWAEREVFSSNGRMDVEDVSADGRTLTATYTNSTWDASAASRPDKPDPYEQQHWQCVGAWLSCSCCWAPCIV